MTTLAFIIACAWLMLLISDVGGPLIHLMLIIAVFLPFRQGYTWQSEKHRLETVTVQFLVGI